MVDMTKIKLIKIPDNIWQQYLDEVYGNIVYCKPDKEQIEKYMVTIP